MYSSGNQYHDYYNSPSPPMPQVPDDYSMVAKNMRKTERTMKESSPIRYGYQAEEPKKPKTSGQAYTMPVMQKVPSDSISYDRKLNKEDHLRLVEESELKSTAMSCQEQRLSLRDMRVTEPEMPEPSPIEIQPVVRQDSNSYFPENQAKKEELPADKSFLDELFEKNKEEMSDIDSLPCFEVNY